MNSPNANSTQAAVQKVISDLQQSSPSSASGSASSAAVTAFSGQLLASVQDYLRTHPEVTNKAFKSQPKDFSVAAGVISPSDIADKSFWSSFGRIVTQTVPIIVQALSKDYTPSKDATGIPPQLAADKDFWAFLNSALTTVVPPLISALSGGKDFDTGTINPPVIPDGKDKSWWSDALSVVAQVAPSVLAAVL